MSFNRIVSSIVDDYISSVLFVDEKAFSHSGPTEAKDKPTELNVEAVSTAFANAGKICSFFAPKSLADIEKCKQLVLKPDIVVLDWNIQINQSYTAEEEIEDDEADDRGHYSLEILKSIVEHADDNRLKVVFVYTGEPGLDTIIAKIAETLGERFHKDQKKYEVNSDNVHILVRLKPDSKVALAGFDWLKVNYEQLPDEVLSSFAKYVSGLMPCFAMKSLSGIRDSAAKILRVYNSQLDSEYLGHQLALPSPDDAHRYLANSFGAAISELIMDNHRNYIDGWVDDWIDQKFSSEVVKKSLFGSSLNVSSASVKAFYHNSMSEDKLVGRINSAFSSDCKVKDEKIKRALSSLFHKDGDNVPQARYDFAALAHSKNLFSSRSTAPVLTQGTIIKEMGEDGQMYLCIQQRCDTARVSIMGIDFLFVPLHKSKPSNVICAIAVGPNDNRYIIRSSSNAKMFHFSPDSDKSPIKAKRVGENRYIFHSSDREFEWVNELKDIFSQRIVAAITSHFARVGVDEAEWLRLEGLTEE